MKNPPSYLFCLLVLIIDIFYIYWVRTTADLTDRWALVAVSMLVGGLSLFAFLGLGYHLAAKRKGQLTIHVPTRVYELGEVLSGTVHLQTHLPLEVQSCRIALAATITSRDSDDRSYEEVIWQREVDLRDAGRLVKGPHTFDVAFTLPQYRDHVTTPSTESTTPTREAVLPEPVGARWFQAITQVNITWTLIATLHVPGADLHEEQIVPVNDGGWW